MSREALVLIHLSSLDSYADLEFEATQERGGAFSLAFRMAEAVLKHDGPVVIVDQGWLFVGRESRPRSQFIYELGINDWEKGPLRYEDWQEVGELEIFDQRGPYRDITWIKFDEQYSSWDDFLPLLEKTLQELKATKVVLGGLFFEHDLREGCVTETYKFLRDKFPTRVAAELVGCVSDYYSEEEELPGGYTHGEAQAED
jgi:hypothetical protein